MNFKRTEPGKRSAFAKLYGSHPLHLLIMLAGFALLGYVVVTATPSTVFRPEGTWWHSMALWLAAAFVVHDLVLFPIYALIDRFMARGAHARRDEAVPVLNYLRVPMLGSGLLFIVFFPGIIRQGAALYFEDTGLTQEPFLGRWLMLTAVLFGVSAVAYGIRGVRARGSG